MKRASKPISIDQLALIALVLFLSAVFIPESNARSIDTWHYHQH